MGCERVNAVHCVHHILRIWLRMIPERRIHGSTPDIFRVGRRFISSIVPKSGFEMIKCLVIKGIFISSQPVVGCD